MHRVKITIENRALFSLLAKYLLTAMTGYNFGRGTCGLRVRPIALPAASCSLKGTGSCPSSMAQKRPVPCPPRIDVCRHLVWVGRFPSQGQLLLPAVASCILPGRYKASKPPKLLSPTSWKVGSLNVSGFASLWLTDNVSP